MDFQAMAAEIVRLGKDFALRRQMAAIGYERTKRYYTYEQFIQSYRDIYAREKEVQR